TVLKARREVAEIHIEPLLDEYIVKLVNGTRQPQQWVAAWQDYVEFGASPCATLALSRAACAHAFLQGRDYVIPDDIIALAPDILRHRLRPSFTARAEQVDANAIIQKLIEIIPIP
ncbi:MAG: AAA family ATPase, partial [Gammaproteobacteria bacterium]